MKGQTRKRAVHESCALVGIQEKIQWLNGVSGKCPLVTVSVLELTEDVYGLA